MTEPTFVIITPEQVERLQSVDELSAYEVSEEEFERRIGNRVEGCSCQHIVCVCREIRDHKEWCRYRISVACPVGITCDPHGREVCAVCDPCTCKEQL